MGAVELIVAVVAVVAVLCAIVAALGALARRDASRGCSRCGALRGRNGATCEHCGDDVAGRRPNEAHGPPISPPA